MANLHLRRRLSPNTGTDTITSTS